MSRIHLSLGGLMAVVAILAAEFAALRSASWLWYSVTYTATLLFLLLATLAARFRRGAARAFWFGFALFGWAYYLMALGPWSATDSRRLEGFNRYNSDLLTTHLLSAGLRFVRGNAEDYEAIGEFDQTTMCIAHLMLTLVVAVLGGLAALAFTGPRRRRERGPNRVARRLGVLLIAAAALGLTLGLAAVKRHPRGPYFPDGVLDADPEIHAFHVDWYSKQLAAMGEPSLWALAHDRAGVTTYRLLWLPSFHHPACVRITHSPGKTTLRAVALSGLGGYEPGQVAIDRTVRLDRLDWVEVEGLLRELGYWDLPTRLPDDGGSDGDQLILEAATAGRYHVVDRWEPDARYLKVCRRFAQLSGLRLGKTLDDYHAPARP